MREFDPERPLTTVRREYFAGAKMRAARVLVASLMPKLEWRHSGLGMLQAYIKEGEGDELRVHVWDRRLRRERIEDAGLLHDHRFDMTSTILLGILRQQEVHLRPYDQRVDPYADAYSIYEIRSNYRKSKNSAAIVETPGAWEAHFRNVDLEAGDQYDYPRGEFHGTYTPGDLDVWGPTVTVIRKTNQLDVPARIVAPVGVTVVHAFDAPMPEAQWRPILESAREALLAAR